MVARQLEKWLEKVIAYPQVIHIQGLRQTGKTTLMDGFRSRFPGSLYFPLFDLVVQSRYLAHPERWVLAIEDAMKKWNNQEPLHVFVDEIQKIPDFFQGIQGLYDQNKGKIKFWIWGSSARALKRKTSETLAGRVLLKKLWPLSQVELWGRESCVPYLFHPETLLKHLATNEPRNYSQELIRLFMQSMLPEPLLTDDLGHAQALLEAYQSSYLENEIRRENLVEDIGIFQQFLSLAANEDTYLVHHATKAKVLGISPHTVKSYYGILEDTFVCRTIHAYSGSLRVQTSKSPKIIFTDTGLARFVSGERGLPPENSSAFGKIIEGFVINEIQKQMEYQQLPWRLSYLRTKTGMEVDLIIAQGSEKIATEIKATSHVDQKDILPLKRLMEMDGSIRHGIIFSRQSVPLQLEDKIYNFPIWNL